MSKQSLGQVKIEISRLSAELETLKKRKAQYESMTPSKQLATELHSSLCHWNHSDGCAWEYSPINEFASPDKARWLMMAEKLLALIPLDKAIQVAYLMKDAR